MHYKIYTANGYSDRSCVTFTIASMCTFRLPVFCICVVYLSIGKLRHFDLYLSKVLLFSLPPVGKMINCVRCTFSVVVVIVQIYDFTFTRNMFSVFLSTLPHSYLWPSGVIQWSIQWFAKWILRGKRKSAQRKNREKKSLSAQYL